MTKPFRPNLAAKCPGLKNEAGVEIKPYVADLTTLTYPLYATPKIDGIRCLIRDGKAVSRTLKPIPNDYIRTTIESANLPDFDGELTLAGAPSEHDFNAVQSAVMSKSGKPDFIYTIFDRSDLPAWGYQTRLKIFTRYYLLLRLKLDWLKLIPVIRCRTHKELRSCHESFMRVGYEGTVTRSPDGLYKQGRSTYREGGMTKIKDWQSSEGTILGFTEQLENHNEEQRDELGYTKRSSSIAGKTGAGTLGAIDVMWRGIIVTVGSSSISHELRQKYWDNENDYMHMLVEFKYFGLSAGGVPRHPIFLRFREPE